MRLEPDGWFFTVPYIIHADKVYDFKFKPTDIVIMTYPKCGTTWTQEIVWTLVNNPNLDNPKGMTSINTRCPFLECDFLLKSTAKPVLSKGSLIYDTFAQTYPDRNPEDGIFLQIAELTEDPRIIKTHLPFSLLSPSLLNGCKIIYVVRDPKDVAVSYCHHSRLLKAHSFLGSTSDFVDHFVNDTVVYSPFWKHVQEAWRLRDKPNILFMYYEDMKADPESEIFRLQKFLNLDLTENQIDNVVHYTSFGVMKVREEKSFMGTEEELANFSNLEVQEKDGGFFRKGVSGDYKKKLSKEDIEKINKWTRENTKDMEGDFRYKIKNVEMMKSLFDK